MESIRPLMPLILVVLFCAVIAACATPEQRAEQRAMQEQEDIRTCVEYGFKPGSEAFAHCRLQIDIERNRPYPHYDYGHVHPHFSYSHWY